MDSDITNQLSTIALHEREARVYTVLLELGPSSAALIAKNARLQRTYVYDLLGTLGQKGLVSHVEKNGRRVFSAQNPEAIKNILEEKLRSFSSLLPQLRSIYEGAPNKPKVRFYEGKEGLTVAYEELLLEKWIDNIGSPDAFVPVNGEYGVELGKRIVELGIRTRELLTPYKNGTENPPHMKNYRPPLQEVRYFSKTVKITTDMSICENKLVLISFEKDIHTIIIEGSGIIDTIKVMFELLWQTTPEYINVNPRNY